MNAHQGNIIVDSCQYTPIYLVQNTGAIQGSSYIISQGNVEETKPLTDNLKRFYENSGIFESNLVNSVPVVSKPRILKKQDNKILKVGNNLKLASFLLPKPPQDNTLNINKQCVPMKNFVMKPAIGTSSGINTLPKVEADRKIVKLKNFPNVLKPNREKTLPKIISKDDSLVTNPTKHTSVQLVKLGETYHSLNQLSEGQVKMVNQALKMFTNTEQVPKPEPTFDSINNTSFVYKVISPSELATSSKNQVIIKNKIIKTDELKKDAIKLQDVEKSKIAILPEKPPQPIEIKVRRSNRQVKFPKHMEPDKLPEKAKVKPNTVTCFQCSTEFCSLYRLQKHYETHPAHGNGQVHSNLFQCFLSIIKNKPEEEKTNTFIQQLVEFIVKLKSLLPCLLNSASAEGPSYTFNDDIGRLLGISPGEYKVNIDGINCVKDPKGNCRHNPSKGNQNNPDLTKSQNDDKIETETEDCARINSVDKWPLAHKRSWKCRQQKSHDLNAKKKRLASDNTDPATELGIDNLLNYDITNDQSAINVQLKPLSLIDNLDLDVGDETFNEQSFVNDKETHQGIVADAPTSGAHTKFHSTHFDIRSSPIKPSGTIFNKIQITPDKLPKYDVQIIQPEPEKRIDDTEKQEEQSASVSNPDFQSIFNEDMIQLTSCKDSNGLPDLSFDPSKDSWIIEAVNGKSNDENFIKSTTAIDPSLLVHDLSLDKLTLPNLDACTPCEPIEENDSRLSTQNSSVLNFLDSLGNECLSYPETEIRNNHVDNVDFQLDLFSFSNS
ncbi:hypothetical protein ACJJTC_000097 [Scirpophaga incertulas]